MSCSSAPVTATSRSMPGNVAAIAETAWATVTSARAGRGGRPGGSASPPGASRKAGQVGVAARDGLEQPAQVGVLDRRDELAQVLLHQLGGTRRAGGLGGWLLHLHRLVSHGKDTIGRDGIASPGMGRTVLITGPGAGLGPRVVAAFADAGWRVVAPVRREGATIAGAETVVADLADPRSGGRAELRRGRSGRAVASGRHGRRAARRGPARRGDAGRGLRGAVHAQPPDT